MDTYVPSESLSQAIKKNDLFRVRGVLVGILQTDNFLGLHDVDKATQYAEECGISLFEEHNDKYVMKDNIEEWNKEYYAYALTYLQENFSRKRFEHAKAVGQYISKGKNSKSEGSSRVSPDFENTRTQKGTAENDTGKKNRLLFVLGGVGLFALFIYLFTRS